MKSISRCLLLLASAILGLSIAAPAAAQKEDWPKSFTVGTASQGGTYFQYGSGWANLVGQELGITGSAEVTGGPAQNLALVQTGQLPFGMTTLGPARDALAGKSPVAPGMKMDKVRAMFPMYETPFTLVTLKNSGIDSVEKLPKGAKVGVGPAGGTADAYFPEMLETLGADIDKRNAGYSDLAGQLQDGLIDAIGFAAGVPVPAISELEATTGINIISFTPEQVQKLETEYPVSPYTIPAETYATTEQDLQTVSMWNFAIANADLPEDFVYNVVKTVMENNDKLVLVHSAAEESIPENAKENKVVPWHPGAVRYYEEKGVELPDIPQG